MWLIPQLIMIIHLCDNSLTALAACVVASDKKALRVLNGTQVKEGEYPFVVVLAADNYRECTGAVIAEAWVLTADHCNVKMGQKIIYGDFTIAPKENSKVKKVLDVKTVPKENPIIGKHDIALCKIEPLKLKEYGKLASADFLSLIGKPVRYIGGGKITVPKSLPKQKYNRPINLNLNTLPLHKGDAVIVKCPKRTGSIFTDTEGARHAFICIRPKCSSRYSSAFFGDSGGPLIHKSKIIGVAHGIDKVDEPNRLNCYTPVSPYLDWIVHTVSNHD